MPASNNERPNWLLLALIAGAAWWMFSGSASEKQPVPPDDQEESDRGEESQPAAADVWAALADYVAADRFGVLNSHTDHVLLIVEELKATGALSDIGRVDVWRGKRKDITAANRAEIVAVLRGAE
jgi:hypothetical protein